MIKLGKKSKYASLKDLFSLKLQALYDIESELLKALPKMAQAATDSELEEAFTSHASETEMHVERIEQCFAAIDMKPAKVTCEGVRGIIADAEWVIKNVPGGELLDANLIAAALYAEHYEMAGYEAAIAWSELLGISDAAELLNTTLQEEMAAIERLASLSMPVNDAALGLGASDMDDEDPEEV